MTTLNTPTTYRPPKSAAVVSSTFWKRWSVSAVGTLEAETVRGPLIIWAKPAAKEEAPKLEEPRPTPLEMRVSVVNTFSHLTSFFGPRWRVNRLPLFYRTRHFLQRRRLKLKISKKLRRSFQIQHLVFLKELYSDLVRRTKLAEEGSGEDKASVIHTKKLIIENICCFVRSLCWPKDFISLIFRALQRAAYLAHIRRRVKPAPRRERIPRPIYARPRPPTAPLAPPVTC